MKLKFDRWMPDVVQSQDAFDTARYWLRTCTESHPSCSERLGSLRRVGRLPTRVVDIGVGDHDTAKIYVSDGAVMPYAALSHCWGGNIPCKTTNALVHDYRQTGLPMEDLPQNFLDAIDVARELGLRYLW